MRVDFIELNLEYNGEEGKMFMDRRFIEVTFNFITIGRKYNFANNENSLIGFHRGLAYREIRFLFIKVEWLSWSWRKPTFKTPFSKE